MLARIATPSAGKCAVSISLVSPGVRGLAAGPAKCRRPSLRCCARRCRRRAAPQDDRPARRHSRPPPPSHGSIRFAIHPDNTSPRAAMACAESSAWLRQPRRTPTTSSTGRSSLRAMSSMSVRSPSGTSTPPAPSTTTTSATIESRRCAAAIRSRSTVTPARAAARCGAIAAGSEYGFTSESGASTLPAATSASTSALQVAPCITPAATGFMPTARTPSLTNARRIATAASVLPTPVSVPVMKMPWVIFRTSRSHAPLQCAAAPPSTRDRR